MRSFISLLLFFAVIIVLRTVHIEMSRFSGSEGFQSLKKKHEEFRGGGSESIGGRTAGQSDLENLGETEQFQKNKQQVLEAFANIGPASSEVVGRSEIDSLDGPADAGLLQPRKPYNLLENLPASPRGSISCLNASCCSETDFESRTNRTGNFLQRTNNYKREFPDSCSAPLTELNLAFYKNSVLPQ